MVNSLSINNNIGTYLGQPIRKVSDMSNPVMGSMYFDSITHQHMLYTGNAWVRLADQTSSTLGKYNDISEEEVLIAKYPGLAELKREADEAIARYRAFYALVKE